MSFRNLALVACCTTLLPAADPSLDALREAGRWKQLRARVQPWLAKAPEDPNALLWMSQVKQAFGDLEGAYGLITKAAQARPEDAAIQAQLAAAAGQKASTAGALSQLSLAREMKKAAEKALALNPRDVETANLLMQFYWMAPGIVGGDKDKARALAIQVAAFDPVRGLLMQADLAMKGKDRTKAEGLFRQAASKPNTTAVALLTYAGFLVNGEPKRPAEALVQARRALSLDPGRASAHGMVAAILALQGQSAEAEAALAAAEKAAPENASPFYTVARTLLSVDKDPARAEALLRRYLAKEPEGGAPTHAQARWRLGQALEKLGRKAEALTEVQTALQLDPSLKGAKEDLKRLKG